MVDFFVAAVSPTGAAGAALPAGTTNKVMLCDGTVVAIALLTTANAAR
jgi:hypothetical protein